MPGYETITSSDGYQLLTSNDEELLIQTNQFSIGFCVSSSEEDRLDKTAYLSDFTWMTGSLREESSIIAPVITVEYAGFPDWNYAYIPNFGRYYFITDIISVRTNLWRIAFRVDPMMSFKDIISGTKAMIERNEFTYNPFMLDEFYPPRYNKEVKEYGILDVVGFRPDIEFKTNVDLTERPHVAVTTINSVVQNINEDYPSPDPYFLPAIVGNNFVNGLRYKSYALDTTDLSALGLDLINNSGHASFVTSVVVFPYELKASGVYDRSYLYVGKDTVKTSGNTPIYVQTLKSPFISYAVLNDFMMDEARSFLDFEPYTTRELYIPYAGWFKIPFEVCHGDEILIYYSIDQMQGDATVYVYDKSKKALLWSSPCQIGTKIPVSTTNNLENRKTEVSNNLNLIMSMIGSVASFTIGAATNNPVAMVGGVLKGVNGISSFIDKTNRIIDRATATSASATTGMSSPQKCRMRKTYNYTNQYKEEFAHQYGKPLREIKRIGALTGYTVVSEVHLEIPSAYPAEVTQIETILKEGFHI